MEQLLNQGIFEPKATPEQTAALERLETLLALIEGWVQTVVADALGDRIPGASALSETLRRRRATGGPAEQTFAHPGRARAAAPQAAGGRGAVGATDTGRRRRCPRRGLAAPRSTAERRGSRRTGRIHRQDDRRRHQWHRRGHRRLGEGLARGRRPQGLSPVDNSQGARCPWQSRSMTRYALNPAMPVLLRPDGAVQVGWDPRRAVLVHPPSGLTARRWPSCCGLCSPERRWRSCSSLPSASMRRSPSWFRRWWTSGVVTTDARRHTRSASIRIHGRGPLSDLLAGALRCSGARDRRSSLTHAAPPASTDLVVLSDFLVADPRVVRDLHAARGAAPAGAGARRYRPGRAAGHSRRDQLPGAAPICTAATGTPRGRPSRRNCATPSAAPTGRPCWRRRRWRSTRSTASSAPCAAATTGDRAAEPPPTLDTTLEFDVNAGSIVARRWSRHPRCSC